MRWLRSLSVLALGFGWLALAPAASAAATCPPDISSTMVTGNVTVPAGATCNINNATIVGSITIGTGGILNMFNSTVEGSISGAAGSFIGVEQNSSVSGGVSQQQGDMFIGSSSVQGPVGATSPVRQFGPDSVTVCGATLRSSLVVSGAPSSTYRINIGGPNPGCTTQTDNVSGSISLTGNNAPVVVANTTGPALACSSDNPAPTNAGNNHFSSTSGQCAGF